MGAPVKAGDLVKVVVSRGRNVQRDDRVYVPGEQLSVEVDEAVRLRRLGFVVDPAAEVIPPAAGPTFTPVSGPTVSNGA